LIGPSNRCKRVKSEERAKRRRVPEIIAQQAKCAIVKAQLRTLAGTLAAKFLRRLSQKRTGAREDICHPWQIRKRKMKKMEFVEEELRRFFFKRERLELNIGHPFKIGITPLFIHMELMEWIFFVLFWILSIGGGLGAPIATFIKGETPIFMIPLFTAFWFGFMWLFFYGWCWFCLGSNFPKRVTVDENGANIEYPIGFLNKWIPKDRLTLSNSNLLGAPILKIKDKRRIKGIWINEYLYRIIEGTRMNEQ
jgi:hypothetical protein